MELFQDPPPSALCPHELCCGGVLSTEVFPEEKTQTRAVSYSPRRSLPDELDGELLAVKQEVVRWELRIHKRTFFSRFSCGAARKSSLSPQCGKIAADDG